MAGLGKKRRLLAMLGPAFVTFLASAESSLADRGRIDSSCFVRDRVLAREVDTKNRVKGSLAFGRDVELREFSEVRGMLLGARAMARKIAVDVTVAEEGDIPVAGDFRMGPGPNGLVRYYFVVDRQGSVLGLVDEGGAWVERVRYDVWGTPVFEAADVMAPEVSKVGTDPGTGDVVIVMSEPVVPRAVLPTAPNQNVALEAIDLSSEVYFEDALGQEVSGRIVVDLDATDEPGVPVGSVLRFIPDSAVLPGTPLVLRLNQGAMVDDGNLGNADTSLAVTYGAGVSYTGPPAGSTQPVLQTQSLTGNRLLFQSHFWDADVGLYHMRARMFDPRSGTFLSRDPSGYVDSVNLYAPMKWDVVNLRDPTGEQAAETDEDRCLRAAADEGMDIDQARSMCPRASGGHLDPDQEATGSEPGCTRWNPLAGLPWCGSVEYDQQRQAFEQRMGEASLEGARRVAGATNKRAGQEQIGSAPGLTPQQEREIRAGGKRAASGAVDVFQYGIVAVATGGTSKVIEVAGAGSRSIGLGYSTFKGFKKALGRAGFRKHWHHIVEQTPGNLNRFGPAAIHNTENLIRVDAKVHAKISGYYSSIRPFTQGKTVREWLREQSAEAQREFGLQVLRDFGVLP